MVDFKQALAAADGLVIDDSTRLLLRGFGAELAIWVRRFVAPT